MATLRGVRNVRPLQVERKSYALGRKIAGVTAKTWTPPQRETCRAHHQ